MDQDNADYGRVVSELQDGLGVSFAPAEWPIIDGGKFTGIADVIEHKAKFFDGKQGDIPADIVANVDAARETLIEGLSDVDDELMEHFLEGADIPPEEIKNVKSIRSN